jgi:hypothetical protein
MGRVYRETTPETVGRVVAAIEARLAVVLLVAKREVSVGRGRLSETAEPTPGRRELRASAHIMTDEDARVGSTT